MKHLTLNPQLTIKEISIPNTNLNAFIIDDFLVNADSVMHFAKNIAYFNPMYSDNSYYPGVRDNMPEPYVRLLQDFFQENIIPKLVGREQCNTIVHKSLISLVTCSPSQLLTEQKMPHVDSCKDNAFAFVHYLSGEELGGTSIYRYIPKDIIEFHEKDEVILDDMLNEVTSKPVEHHGYITNSTSLFEQVLKVEAKFNRLVIYQGNLLHGANLTSKESYSGDTTHGRFSITSFASISDE
ncbi:hypothetical protein ESZ36_14900 [Colwellia demingiae]|uniref:2OG-Fe(II) oxygenase n=1 Tax=Colwellia demingiae TaxID=89401 RepID=A0A5C6QDK5_9GAMM|nr:DUF6445 family protein [Colwellia demingiae]TWX66841.1 hypothetical protein ESZ36_14900 [Colwellia demingiae]